MSLEKISQNYENTPDVLPPDRDEQQRVGSRIGSIIDGEVEGEQKTAQSQERRQNSAMIASVAAINPATFTDVYTEDELRKHQKYVEETQRRLGKEDPTGLAQKFEELFLFGVQMNDWLENRKNESGKRPFWTESFVTAKYDDYRHRIDGLVNIRNRKPIEVKGSEIKENFLPIGLDVTLQNKKAKVMDKITRQYNDPRLELPFGFSMLSYYRTGVERERDVMVPRYTIGLSGEELRDTLELAKTRYDAGGHVKSAQFSPVQSAPIRFMVLSEIHIQNQLYNAMLPEELDTPMLQRAKWLLGASNKMLLGALNESARDMLGQKWLFSDAERAELLDMWENASKKEMRERVQARVEKHCEEERGEEYDSYVLIMQSCRELAAAAKDGRLDAYKGVMVHNQWIEI